MGNIHKKHGTNTILLSEHIVLYLEGPLNGAFRGTGVGMIAQKFIPGSSKYQKVRQINFYNPLSDKVNRGDTKNIPKVHLLKVIHKKQTLFFL